MLSQITIGRIFSRQNLGFVTYYIDSKISTNDKIQSFLKSMVVINLFVQAVMLAVWVKLPGIYLPG